MFRALLPTCLGLAVALGFMTLDSDPARAEMPEARTAQAEAAEIAATAEPQPGAPDTAAVMTTAELVAMADEVAAEVAELRGWPFKTPVPKSVRNEDELRDYMIESFEKEFPGEMPQRIGASLTTVGLLPPGTDMMKVMIDVLMNQVGGFYDPPTKAFYMVNREGLDLPPAVMKMMVAHELTHALDDQYVSLDSLIHRNERTEDGEFAVSSVIEGSATILMSRYLTRLQLSGKLSFNDLNTLMESEAERSKPLIEAPPYFHTVIGRYTLGMLFLLQNDMTLLMDPDAGGIVGGRFLAAAADPPQSSEQIIHPGKYWNEAARDLPVVADDGAVEPVLAGLGWEVFHRETFGEILMALLGKPADEPLNLMAATTSAGVDRQRSHGLGRRPVLPVGAGGG